MKGSNEFGVIYVASGEKYVDEAAVSAMSVRRHMPEIPIHLHTDLQDVPEVFDTVSEILDCRYNCHDKVPPLIDSPFEKTLFLDTDTYLCEPIEEIITLLDRFDFLMCHTPFRDPNPIGGIPACFTEFNTGVLAFRKNEHTDRCLQRWLELYAEMGHKADQPAFRRALWEDLDIRYYILPPEYNFRTIFPGFIGGGSRVKVIHGRHKNWDKIERKLNATTDPRVMIVDPLSISGGRLIVLRSFFDLLKSFIKKCLKPYPK